MMKQARLSILTLLIVVAGWAPMRAATDNNVATLKLANELMDYIYWHHEDHATYFQLGEIFSQLYSAQHPIRDYKELQVQLYNIGLYYGNCLHYAKDQSLKQEIYLSIPHAGKRTTYDELNQELTKRINNAKDLQQRSTELYSAYTALNEHYEQCRLLYVEFAETYLREKTAHLLLDSVHTDVLYRLEQMTDSAEHDIQRYQQALKGYPIEGYSPTFHWQEIRLYRIDGLAKTELLQQDVMLWNYRQWVEHFLEEHTTLYRDYYNAIAHDLAGKGSDENLLNMMNRLDYESYMHAWFAVRQGARQMLRDTSAPWIRFEGEDYLANVLPEVQKESEKLQELRAQQQLLIKRISDSELRKYTAVLERFNMAGKQPITADAHRHVLMADSAYRAICRQVVEHAVPLYEPFEQYTNELTGERIDAAMLSRLGITEQGVVVTILPMGYQYMAVLANHKIIIFDATKIYGDVRTFAGSSPIRKAVKMSSNTIAILMEDNIIFVNNRGEVIKK